MKLLMHFVENCLNLHVVIGLSMIIVRGKLPTLDNRYSYDKVRENKIAF